jgi:hypothetical protein
MPSVRLPRREYDVVVYMDTTGQAVASSVFGRELARSTDHTAVIQAAIDSVPDGGSVFIDKGVYNMTYKKSIQWYDSYGNLHSTDAFRVAVEVNKSVVIHGAGAVLRLADKQDSVILYAHRYSRLELSGITFDGNRANNTNLSIGTTITPFDGYSALLTGGCSGTGLKTPCFRSGLVMHNVRFVNVPGWAFFLGNHAPANDSLVKAANGSMVASEFGAILSDVYVFNSKVGPAFDNFVKGIVNGLFVKDVDMSAVQVLGQSGWFTYSHYNNIRVENAGVNASSDYLFAILISDVGLNSFNNVFIRSKHAIKSYTVTSFSNVALINYQDANFSEAVSLPSWTSALVFAGPVYVSGLYAEVTSQSNSHIITCEKTECILNNVKIATDSANVLRVVTDGTKPVRAVVNNLFVDTGGSLIYPDISGTAVVTDVVIRNAFINRISKIPADNRFRMYLHSVYINNVSVPDASGLIFITGGSHVIRGVDGSCVYTGTSWGACIRIEDSMGPVDVEIDGVRLVGSSTGTPNPGILVLNRYNTNSASVVVARNLKSRVSGTGYDVYDASSAGMLYLFGHDIKSKYVANATLVKEISPIA